MNKLQTLIAACDGGFITADQMPELINLDRLCPLLVRCGNGRFTTAAQNVAHFIKCVEAGGDYVRDVSFPVGSVERAAAWVCESPVTAAQMLPAAFLAPKTVKVAVKRSDYSYGFDEMDCSGVFDGHQVTSDADSGL